VFCLTIVEHEAASRVAIQQAMYARSHPSLELTAPRPARCVPRPTHCRGRSALLLQRSRSAHRRQAHAVILTAVPREQPAAQIARLRSGLQDATTRARASRVSKSACAEERSCRREVFAKAECFPMRAATALTLQCSAPAKRA
jgi:hypothetical protein